MNRKPGRRIAWICLAVLAILIVAPFANIIQYPRIVRSAYLKYPVFVYKAFAYEYLEPKRYTQEDAVQKIESKGFESYGAIRYLYLSHSKGIDGDRPIIDRYFNLVSKWGRHKDQNSEKYWEIGVKDGLILLATDTGQMVFYKKDLQGDYMEKPVVME